MHANPFQHSFQCFCVRSVTVSPLAVRNGMCADKILFNLTVHRVQCGRAWAGCCERDVFDCQRTVECGRVGQCVCVQLSVFGVRCDDFELIFECVPGSSHAAWVATEQ